MIGKGERNRETEREKFYLLVYSPSLATEVNQDQSQELVAPIYVTGTQLLVTPPLLPKVYASKKLEWISELGIESRYSATEPGLQTDVF